MSNIIDFVSRLIGLCTNVLILHDKVKTALGVVLGIFIFQTSIIFKAQLNILGLNTSEVSMFGYLFMGLGIIYIVDILKHILSYRKFPQSIEESFRAVDELKKRGVLEKWEIKKQYLNIVDKALEKIELDDKASRKMLNRTLVKKDEAPED